jgi:hypothetical protein
LKYTVRKSNDSKVFGHVQSYFVGGFNNGYGKARLPQKTSMALSSSNFPIIISQVSMSIFMMRFSLKGVVNQ